MRTQALIQEPVHPLALFSDVSFEHSKVTAILSDNDISHVLSGNVSGSVSTTGQFAEDSFKDT